MSGNLFLSIELIYLMNWLLKNEPTGVKKLITQALENGLDDQLENLQKLDLAIARKSDEAVSDTFLDFISLLEDSLLEGLETKKKPSSAQEDLAAVLKQVDLHNFDVSTIIASLKETKKELSKEKHQNDTTQEVKKLLVDKLLENWKPTKNEQVN